MTSGFPGRDLYGNFAGLAATIHQAQPQPQPQRRPEDGGGGMLKRRRTEMERLQQQQLLQHALFLRSVKQKIHQNLPISPLSPLDLYSSSSPIISPPPPLPRPPMEMNSFSGSSCSSSLSNGYGFSSSLARPRYPGSAGSLFAPPSQGGGEYESAAVEKKSSAIRDQLQELERSLLGDEEDEDETSVSTSAVTTAEFSEAMHQLISSSVANKPLSPSPTTSLSSSSSCTAAPSSSPPPPTVQLRQLLVETANAVSDGNLEAAKAGLGRLNRAANPRGDPEQRLTAIMVSALMSRVNPPPAGTQPHPIAELCTVENVAATHLLHDTSPCFKLGLLAANYAILEAAKDCAKIHILDFDVGHGGQYASLIRAIAEQRRHLPTTRLPVIKITAVTDPTLPFNALSTASNKDSLKLVGEQIAMLAERAGVGLLFNIVCRRTAELDRATLGCEPGEALAVNFAFLLSRVADESVSPANPRDELLRRVKDLGPRVVTLVEQEMNSNTAPFATRFAEACNHYGAVLESLDATMARESGERARVEGCLARKAANSVAQEGPDRVERCEVFGKWRARLGMAGFHPTPLGPAVADPIRNRLGSLQSNPGFTLKEDAGRLCFGWMGRVLTVASTWRLVEA